MATANEIYEAARELPCDEKHLLVLMLQQDIDAEEKEEGYDEAWDAEIAKRLDEIDSGKVTMLSKAEAHAIFRS
jgi:putative addiction module component (TIGR02574 family)